MECRLQFGRQGEKLASRYKGVRVRASGILLGGILIVAEPIQGTAGRGKQCKIISGVYTRYCKSELLRTYVFFFLIRYDSIRVDVLLYSSACDVFRRCSCRTPDEDPCISVSSQVADRKSVGFIAPVTLREQVWNKFSACMHSFMLQKVTGGNKNVRGRLYACYFCLIRSGLAFTHCNAMRTRASNAPPAVTKEHTKERAYKQ